MQLILCKDNRELLDKLNSTLTDFISKPDFELLRDTLMIFTRERITSEYLKLKLAEKSIPSLAFETKSLNSYLPKFLSEEQSIENRISPLACKILIRDILLKSEKENSPKAAFKNAESLYSEWEISISKQEKFPEKHPYFEVIKKFLKLKKGKFTRSEFINECINKQKFIPEAQIEKKFGKKILLYGIIHIDKLIHSILKHLDKYIEILAFVNKNYLLEYTSPERERKNGLYDREHIISLYDNTQNENDIDFAPKTKVNFYSAPEIYREIEFVARDILTKISVKQDKSFRLTNVKVILPDDATYSVTAQNIFDRMGIPTAFTTGLVYKKLSPYYTAFVALLKLVNSNFEQEAAFSLFHNPCFYPELDRGRENFRTEKWLSIMANINLSGYLDKIDRKRIGFRSEDFLTWNYLWDRLNLLISGAVDDSGIFSDEDREEAFKFMKISSSLFNDLINLKERKWKPREFATFLRSILETYLFEYPRITTTDKLFQRLENLNISVKDAIFEQIAKIESIEDELSVSNEDLLNFSFEDYTTFLLEKLDFSQEGSSRLIKSGIVVGTMKDTLDPIFDYVYFLGFNENRVPETALHTNSYSSDKDLIRHDIRARSRDYFYRTWCYGAEEINISYQRLDTLHDRPIYPSSELANLREFFKEEFCEVKQIPLIVKEEALESTIKNILLDEESLGIVSLSRIQKEIALTKNFQPVWLNELSTEKQEFASSLLLPEKLEKNNFKNEVLEYFFRTQTKQTKEVLNDVSVNLNEFAKYLECPKKYDYNYVISLEEEEEVGVGESYSIKGLVLFTFLKSLFLEFLKNPDIDDSIVSIYMRDINYSRNLPRGILAGIEEKKLKTFVSTIYFPFLKEKFKELEIYSRVKFNSDANIVSETNLIFPSGLFLGRRADFIIPYLSVDKNKSIISFLYPLANMDKLGLKKLRGVMPLLSVIESKELQQAIASRLKINSPSFEVSFLLFGYGKEKGTELTTISQFKSSDSSKFKSLLNLFLSEEYPAIPLDEGGSSCSYCNIRNFCFGYKSGFEALYQNERDEILEILK